MQAAVTGGAGFIGHHLVTGLVGRGHRVKVIDDLSSGHLARLAPLQDRIALTQASILDPAALDATFSACEVVFHEAAVASVARSLVEPRLTNDVNVSGTIEVILAAARAGVRRVIFAGSSAVYGVPAELPCVERQRADPTSPYGASKLAAEHYLHTLGTQLGVETVVLRYFNVYGAGQDPAAEYAAVVPRFITAAIKRQPPTIYGSGDISRDFVHVDDVVAANLLAARDSSPSGLTCNIASGSQTTLLELVAVIGEAADTNVQPVFGPARSGDIPASHADISLARQALGFEPAVSLRDGIARTMDAFRSQPAAARS
jgi:UDP-glucose 4-epimerase